MSVEEAEGHFRRQPFEDMGYAKLDMHRKMRSGFPEVIFCSGKPDEFLVKIYKRMAEADGQAFGTRASAHQYELVKKEIPDITYDPVSRILKLERTPKERKGLVAVVTGGTADIPVAEEAAQTAEYFGTNVERIYDVGVSGIHRLLAQTDKLQQANCIVAVAGMEGALASVVGGLVSNPVIAVPTSVGYGANFGGLSALMTTTVGAMEQTVRMVHAEAPDCKVTVGGEFGHETVSRVVAMGKSITNVKVGDRVERGDSLCALYTGEDSELPEEKLFDAMDLILDAYEIGPNPPEKKPAILGVIT